MDNVTPEVRGLTPAQIEQFITDGFLCIDHAFPRALADAALPILWNATGCSPDDPTTWGQPVIRLGMFTQAPFIEAANTPRLRTAFDQLVGPGRWRRPAAIGTFPVRFPSAVDPGDAGWHIDASFRTDTPDFLSWRANIHSKGRALLMLFLLSDVGERDAPTRIRVGSHADIARQLAAAGEQGLTLRELAADGFSGSAHHPVVTALAMRVRCTCVIRSWCTPRSRTKVSGPDSWRNRRCCPRTQTIGRAAISIPSSRRPSEPSGVASESIDKVSQLPELRRGQQDAGRCRATSTFSWADNRIAPTVRSVGSGTQGKLAPYRWRQQLPGIRTVPICANALRTLALDDETRGTRLQVIHSPCVSEAIGGALFGRRRECYSGTTWSRERPRARWRANWFGVSRDTIHRHERTFLIPAGRRRSE